MRIAILAVAAVSLLGLVAAEAQADQIRVSQESGAGVGDFDANVLGTVDLYSHAGTIADFYNYGNGDGSSYNGDDHGGPGTTDKLSQIFFVDASDGRFLVVVHDDPLDGTGGKANMSFRLVGDTASIAVKDDGGDSYGGNGSTTFTSKHNWLACCTDGMAIGGLDNGWTMYGQFTSYNGGITSWQTTDVSGGTDIALVLGIGREVRFDAVPEPGTLGLMGLGLLVGAGFVRRRRSA